MTDKNEVALKEIEFRLLELEKSFELAQMGLRNGSTGVGLTVIGLLLIIGSATYAHVKTGQALLSGLHLVLITLISVGGLLVYFAFIFRREARIMAQWEKARLEMGAGRGVK